MSVLRSLIRIGGFTLEPVFPAKRFYRGVEVRGGYERAQNLDRIETRFKVLYQRPGHCFVVHSRVLRQVRAMTRTRARSPSLG